MAWSLFKFSTRSLILVLLVLTALLMFTERGNRWLIEQVADRYGLTIEGLQGSLRSTLCVDRFLAAPAPGQEIEVLDACLDVNLLASAAAGHLRFKQVTARLLRVTTPPESAPEGELLPVVEIPLLPFTGFVSTLSIESLQINDDVLRRITGRSLKLSSYQSEINRLTLQTDEYSLDVSLSVKKGTRVDRLAGSGVVELSDRSVSFTAEGATNALDVTLTVAEGGLVGTVDLTRVNWPFDVEATVNPVSLQTFGLGQMVRGRAALRGDALDQAFSGQFFSVDGRVTVSGSRSPRSIHTAWVFQDFPVVLESAQGLLNGRAEVQSDTDLGTFDFLLMGVDTPWMTEAISGSGRIVRDADVIRFSDVSLSSGAGTLSGTGYFGDPKQWSVNATADSLDIIYGELNTRVSAVINASPERSIVNLSLGRTRYEDIALDSFNLAIDTSAVEGMVRASTPGVTVSDIELGGFDLYVNGDLRSGSFELVGGPGALSFTSAGSYRVEAELLGLEFEALALSTDDPVIGPEPFLTLAGTGSADLTLSGDLGFAVALKNRFGGEATMTFDRGEDRAGLKLQDFQVPLYPLAGSDYSLSARVTGNLISSGVSNFAVKGDLEVSSFVVEGTPQDFPELDVERGVILIELEGDRSQATISVGGSIPELLEIEGSASIVEQSPVSGNLHLALLYPEIISPYLAPWASRPTGEITADIALSPEHPDQVSGRVDWVNGSLDMEMLGLNLVDLNMEIVSADSESMDIRVSAKDSLGQPVSVNGALEGFGSDEFLARLNLAAEQALLINRSDARATVTSDVDYRFEQDVHHLAGTLGVRDADYKLSTLPTTVALPSDDVQVVGRVSEVPRRQLQMDLLLAFDKSTYVEAFGLKTHLSGKLNYRATPGKPVTLTGSLSTVDGSFGIYGQNLVISRGELVFDGPIDDPLVDVVATKSVRTPQRNYVVSVNLQGYASALSTEITSVPELPEADALSLLLTGRLLSDTVGQEKLDIAAAGLSLGLKGSSYFTDRIALLTGLDDITLSKSADGIELGADRQITRNLFLRYTYGSFSRIGGILVEYQINENLRLRANTGDKESLEVQYVFPR